MKTLTALFVAISASANCFAQCPTMFYLTGGGTVCSNTTDELHLSGSEVGVSYQLTIETFHFPFEFTYENEGPAFWGTGQPLLWNVTFGKYKVIANKPGCPAITMEGNPTVSTSLPPSFILCPSTHIAP